MALMRGYQVPVPTGVVATTPAEAEAAADRVRAASNKPSPVVVLKAQVLAGGRGRGTFSNGFKSGVHMITKKGQAAEVAAQMLGHRLITKQTGEEGKPTNSVYLMEGLQVARELYISIMLDRASSGCVIIASPSGGMSIEDVAAATPELISKELVELTAGPTPQQLDRLAAFMKFAPGSRGSSQFKDCVRCLCL